MSGVCSCLGSPLPLSMVRARGGRSHRWMRSERRTIRGQSQRRSRPAHGGLRGILGPSSPLQVPIRALVLSYALACAALEFRSASTGVTSHRLPHPTELNLVHGIPPWSQQIGRTVVTTTEHVSGIRPAARGSASRSWKGTRRTYPPKVQRSRTSQGGLRALHAQEPFSHDL